MKVPDDGFLNAEIGRGIRRPQFLKRLRYRLPDLLALLADYPAYRVCQSDQDLAAVLRVRVPLDQPALLRVIQQGNHAGGADGHPAAQLLRMGRAAVLVEVVQKKQRPLVQGR